MSTTQIQLDTDPSVFVRVLIAVFHTTAQPGWEQSTRRLVEILITGSRPTRYQPESVAF